MKRRDLVDLLLLAMLWGASFLFMRLSVPEFGPMPMVEMRVAIAAMFLVPLLLRQHPVGVMTNNWRGLAFVGITNSAIPFVLFGYAMLSLTSGFAAIINSTAPLFGALVAWVWLRDRMPWQRFAGLLVGFVGVAVLVWGRPTSGVSAAAGSDMLAIAAAIGASVSYGFAPSFMKRHLAHVPPLAIATGSQVIAAIALLPFAIAWWPSVTPSATAWSAAVALGIGCTGIAYILYFRLIRNIGPTRAMAVTFLVPALGMLYGALFLSETVTLEMIVGCAVILAGTALATLVPDARRRGEATVGTTRSSGADSD